MCLTACILFPFSSAFAQYHDQPPVEQESKTYLVCYYRNIVTGQTTWEWGKDDQNHDISIEGEWTDNTAGGMLKINGRSEDFEPYFNRSCENTNHDAKRVYAEYGVANNSTSYKHQIWFEQTSANTHGFPFSRFVAFGDSLSDNGNLYNFTHEEVVSGSYYMGRFSNGPVWTEYVSKYFAFDFYDWAVAGVTEETSFPLPYTMDNQVDNYISTMKHVLNPDYANTLFSVFIGSNNYIYRVDVDPNKLTSQILGDIEKLVAIGARHFIIPTLPDISATPLLSWERQIDRDVTHQRVFLHNQLIEKALQDLKVKYPFVHFISPDSQSFLDDVISHPDVHRLSNVTERCDRGLPLGHYNKSTFCDQPKDYLFWDFVHPSTKVHCQMAQNIMVQMENEYQIPHLVTNYDECEISYVNK